MPRTQSDAVSADRLFPSNAPPVLDAGNGTVLRPWRDDDAPAVHAVYQDPEVQRWHVRNLESDDEALDLLRTWRSRWDDRSGVPWAVADAATHAVLARVELNHLDLDDGVADVAYWAAPAARGRGVVPAAVRRATDWAFGAGLHRPQAEHSVHNLASCRAATKAGLDAEGVRRSAVLHADGWHDMHVHATVRGERRTPVAAVRRRCAGWGPR